MTHRLIHHILPSVICGALVLSGCDRNYTTGEVEVSQQPEQTTGQPVDAARAERVETTTTVDPAKRARLERLLGGFEHLPTSEELHAVEEQDDALRALLMDIYQDTSVKRGARQRALSAMQYAPGEETNTFYRAKLRDPSTENAERRILIKAYANAAGDAAEETLIEQLAHRDVTVRGFVVEELGKINSPTSLEALEQRARVETALVVREKIGTVLGRDIGEAPEANQEIK